MCAHDSEGLWCAPGPVEGEFLVSALEDVHPAAAYRGAQELSGGAVSSGGPRAGAVLLQGLDAVSQDCALQQLREAPWGLCTESVRLQ